MDLRKSVLVKSLPRTTSTSSLASKSTTSKITVDSRSRAPGATIFAKAVNKIVLAKKFASRISLDSREKSAKSTIDIRENLKPNFSNGYKFSYALLVEAAIYKYSPRLAHIHHFNFPENEVDICRFPQLYKEYTSMQELKERDKTSPKRRVAWAYNVEGKAPPSNNKSLLTPRLPARKGNGYSRPVSRESYKLDTPKGILKSTDNLSIRACSSYSSRSRRPGSSQSSQAEETQALPVIVKEQKKTKRRQHTHKDQLALPEVTMDSPH